LDLDLVTPGSSCVVHGEPCDRAASRELDLGVGGSIMNFTVPNSALA